MSKRPIPAAVLQERDRAIIILPEGSGSPYPIDDGLTVFIVSRSGKNLTLTPRFGAPILCDLTAEFSLRSAKAVRLVSISGTKVVPHLTRVKLRWERLSDG